MHPDFIVFEKYIRDIFGWICVEKQMESESAEYAAIRFRLNGTNIIFRTAKITPTKTGQFVTLWKRDAQGNTAPFDETDMFDVVVIFCRSAAHTGQFVFPKEILLTKGIISGEKSIGKRGIRVYPSWDTPLNKQAQQTQTWQLDYFSTRTEALVAERLKAISGTDN